MTNLIAALIAIAVGAFLGLVVFLIYRRVDKAADDLQRKLNKFENLFVQTGASWVAELLEDMIVGDAPAIRHKLTELVESVNSMEVFMDKIGKPITVFTLHYLKLNAPEELSKILSAEGISNEVGNKKSANAKN